MARITLGVGIALVLLGAVSYLVTGRESVTALIPAFFGLAFLPLGALMRDPGKEKHAGHVAMVLALVGLLGSARGVPSLVTLLQGGEVARPAAAVAQSLMVLVCIVFLALGVKSFRDARRARAEAAD